MTNYSVPETIKNASRNELVEIFRWLQSRGEDFRSPITVLIGGWAVYSYNQWYGSVDIDLVTNNKTRHDLIWHLRNDRGFVYQREKMAPTTIGKAIPEGTILIDFGSREEIYRFEGRGDVCPFSLLDGRTEVRDIGAGFPVVVPEMTLLMIFKLKAAWDRSYRIQSGISSDEEWEKAKLHKDRADILSLIDPNAQGTDIDIFYLGEMLDKYPFLAETLRGIPYDDEAVNMYRRMNQIDARDSIEKLLMLVL